MPKISEKRLLHLNDLINYDKAAGNFGVSLAGMDEAGRGPLVGNVVAACVIMPGEPVFEWVDDSKKLSFVRRDELYSQIMEHALFVGIGMATAEEIDAVNILNATRIAMERAAKDTPADLCIVDAVKNLKLPCAYLSVIKADATSYNVAAASIIAKVTRDRQMLEYAQMYPQYGFERNMGYGTREHMDALLKYGPTPEHRRTFIRKLTGDSIDV